MGRDYRQLKRFLKHAQRWSRRDIEAWQLTRLKELLRYAYQNVPGYHVLFREAGIEPRDVKNLDDICSLPFTTKDLLRDNAQDFKTRSLPEEQLDAVQTSGSTGIPLIYYQTPVNAWMEWAFVHSSFERVGWVPGDMSAILRGHYVGSPGSEAKHDPERQQLLLSGSLLDESTYHRYVEAITRHKPKHLQAYPSLATKLADLVCDNGDEGRLDFRLLLLGSEKLYAWQKERLKRAFPRARLFSFYGHGEQTVFAPWCERTEFFHDWPFYGLTEILDSRNTGVGDGECGEIVGTSFWNYGTPMIRYRTMDLARRHGWGCEACGRQCLLLEEIVGRMQEQFVTRTGRLVPMISILRVMNLFAGLRRFQFYQDTPGRVILRVVPEPTFSDGGASRLREQLRERFGPQIDLEIVVMDDVARTARGKLKFLDQRLVVPEYRSDADLHKL